MIFFVALGLAVSMGCGTTPQLPESEPVTPSQPRPDSLEPSFDPFEYSNPVELVTDGMTTISGRVQSATDIEVWDLGSIDAGSRLVVDVTGSNNNLSIGLFDQDRQVMIINHNRYNSPDPYAVLQVPQNVKELYLAVSSDPSEASFGDYTATITHNGNMDITDSQLQVVVLDFAGSDSVRIGNLDPIAIDAFQASDLTPDWNSSDDTAAIKQAVMQHMQRMYAGLNVEFYFDDEEIPAGQSVTLVYFGGSDPHNVGLSSSVDYGNFHRDDTAIVYTLNFGKYTTYGYDAQDIAAGLANVAAHELGHLLGLNHSDDVADVMNVSPTVATLLTPKYFVSTAKLDTSVFATGDQDGADRVYNTVGGNWNTVEDVRQTSAETYDLLSRDINARAATTNDHAQEPCLAQ